MIDRVGGDGGQARAAKHLNWTTSTVSRDYKGDTLPTDERLFQLGNALQLPHREMLDLASLLRRARVGRRDRLGASRANLPGPPDSLGPPASSGPANLTDPATSKPAYFLAQSPGTPGAYHSAGPPVPDRSAEPPGQYPRRRAWFRGRGRLAAVLSVAAVAALAAVVLVLALPGSSAPAKPAAHGQTTSGVLGSFAGMTMEAVRIPVRSLTPVLAAQFRQGRTAHAATVTGFVFRNHEAAGLCLTAPDTGAKAGQDQDPIVVTTCHGAPDQVWLPLQWEVKGFRFTHLVSDRYQSMCLNANNLGGLNNGHIVQLWDCYPAGNEAWDFGDWHAAVSAGTRSYPLFARNGRLCLDADKWDLRDGTSVRIWTQYPAPNQFWS
jgi:Ricin-type beta-trefoil lectin domain